VANPEVMFSLTVRTAVHQRVISGLAVILPEPRIPLYWLAECLGDLTRIEIWSRDRIRAEVSGTRSQNRDLGHPSVQMIQVGSGPNDLLLHP
jgi:hypothetical protein